MIQLKKIELSEIKDYVRIAFDGDYQLIEYFDYSAKVDSADSMVSDVVGKLKDYPKWFSSYQSYSVGYNETPIGYLFVTKEPNLLVSFSINKEYRSKDILSSYFECIKKELDNDFSCLLFSHNKRAINWLEKCGMVKLNELYEGGLIKLNYSLCPLPQ